MGKKQPGTPRSKVRWMLRALWLRSRERTAAIKREHNTCQRCGKKGSVAKGKEVKINVHHKNGIADIEKLIDMVFATYLCNPELLEVLCEECHTALHLAEKLEEQEKQNVQTEER